MTDANSQDPGSGRARNGVSRRRFLQGAAGGAAFLVGAPILQRVPPAQAAASNPIVFENQQAGSPVFQLGDAKYNGAMGGFTTRASVNRGEDLQVKVAWYPPTPGAQTTAQLQVYRLGYYGGAGGRLVSTVSPVQLDNQGFAPPFDQFGYTAGGGGWPRAETIPTADLTSGMYLIKVVGGMTGPNENHIPFVVREDSRARDVLVVLPTNTWQAYNSWPGKCLYVAPSYDDSVTTIAGAAPDGHSRAVKLSFDRVTANVLDDLNWVLRTEFPLIYWLEQQGYDVTYTEDAALDAAPAAQLEAPLTKTLAFAGHSEYWTQEMFDKVIAARDAGTNIASFSANTAYWKVRYEDARRTLVCFKTVEGRNTDGADGGKDGVNDFGPGASARGGASDPLGPGGQQGGGNDQPEFATTTFRDAGTPPGSPTAPDSSPAPRSFEGLGRVGPDRPENQLWGVMFVGGTDLVSYPLQVPAGSGNGGEFGSHPAWRHTSLAGGGGAQIGTNIVGWEWDAIPQGTASQAFGRYVSRQPAGVKRLAATDPSQLIQDPSIPDGSAAGLIYLQDEGHTYSHGRTALPPAGQPPQVHAVTYRAPSGALVFSAGTMQWSFGLGPHFDSLGDDRTYMSPRVDGSVQAVIQQATYNILADGGVAPATPVGIVLDSSVAPPPSTPPSTGPPKSVPPSKKKIRVTIARNRRRVSREGLMKLRATLARGQVGGAFVALDLTGIVTSRSGSGRLRRRRIYLGTLVADLGPGQSRVLTLELAPEHRRLLARRRRMRVLVSVQAFDKTGNETRSSLAFRLDARPRGAPRRAP